MKILILTPTAHPSITGNAVTVERWRSSLERRGCRVEVAATEQMDGRQLRRLVREFRPELVHAHHALKSGRLYLDEIAPAVQESIPLILSPAGTDIADTAPSPSIPEATRTVCRASAAIISQSPWLSELMHRQVPDVSDRLVYIPKAWEWRGSDPFDPRATFGWESGQFLFFFPAGIRPVKNNLTCLRWLKEVHQARPSMRALFAGPPLDGSYTDVFTREMARCTDFARWIEIIPPGAMKAAFEAADVVLNASRAEGLSNTLLESIAAGTPVLASRIPGNQWPLEEAAGEHPCGLLFDPAEPLDFIDKAIRLIDAKPLLQHLSDGCRLRAARLPRPEDEAHALHQIYAAAGSGRGPSN